jgi:hypothetical protein
MWTKLHVEVTPERVGGGEPSNRKKKNSLQQVTLAYCIDIEPFVSICCVNLSFGIIHRNAKRRKDVGRIEEREWCICALKSFSRSN